MKLLSMRNIDFAHGGKKNFNGLVPSPDVVKEVLKALCFSPFLASFEHHKEFIRSIVTGAERNITSGQVVISVILTTGLTATSAYTCDLVDYIYNEYGITAKYFPDES